MRLDNPAALVLMLCVLLIFFTRPRSTRLRLPVANLYLWQDASSSRTTALARRVRRHWLSILQAAFLSVIVIAMATPLVPRAAPVAVILDASLSMGARHGAQPDGATRFDAARAEATALLERLPRSSRVRLVVAGPQPRTSGHFEASAAAARAAIDAAQPTGAAADLSAAIQHARAADEPPQRIYVFSDADASLVAGASSADVEWSTVGAPVANAAITHLNARALEERPDRLQVIVSVANYGDTAVHAPLLLAQADGAVGRQPIAVPPRGRTTHAFMADNVPGVLTARLEHEDALSSDNVRSLVAAGPSQTRVLLVGDGSPFVRQALTAHPDIVLVASGPSSRVVSGVSQPRVAADVVGPAPSSTGAAEAGDYDLVVCDGCSALPDGAANVLFIPSRAAPPGDAVALATVTAGHPLADGLALEGTTAVLVPGGEAPAAATVIAQGGGSPAIVAYETAGRRVVELRLDPNGGSFPFSTVLPVLVANSVDWLADRASTPETITAGEPLRWRVGAQRAVPVVTGPDGQPLPSAVANGLLTLTETSTAGVYRLQLDGGERLVTVNPATEGESDLGVLSAPAPAQDPGTVPGATFDASALMVMAALLLLALEWRYRTARVSTA